MAESEGGSGAESPASEVESIESIPQGFISLSESEEGLHVYDGDGEGKGYSRWEDPDEGTSSNESGVEEEDEEEGSGDASDDVSVDEESSADSDDSGALDN